MAQDLAQRLGAGAGDAPARVTVVLVPSPAAVAQVRAAIDADRIVAESPEGFAVREGRAVAAGVDRVGALIGAAGWTDAKLEIVKPGERASLREAGPADTSGRDAELNTLRGKAELTPAEAARAIQLLE